MEPRPWHCVLPRVYFLFRNIFGIYHQWETFRQTWKKIFNYVRNGSSVHFLNSFSHNKHCILHDIHEVRIRVQLRIYDRINNEYVRWIVSVKISRKRVAFAQFLCIFGQDIWNRACIYFFRKLYRRELETDDVLQRHAEYRCVAWDILFHVIIPTVPDRKREIRAGICCDKHND